MARYGKFIEDFRNFNIGRENINVKAASGNLELLLNKYGNKTADISLYFNGIKCMGGVRILDSFGPEESEKENIKKYTYKEVRRRFHRYSKLIRQKKYIITITKNQEFKIDFYEDI